MANTPWWKGKKGEWYVVVQVFLFLLIVFAPRTVVGWPVWGEALYPVSLLFGILLIVVGGLLCLAGLAFLGRNLSALPHPLDEAEFVNSGPYKLVRHPIYSGILMAAFGWGFFVQGYLTIMYTVLLMIFFDFKTRREERFLRKKFPEYEVYSSKVKKLIPFIY